MPPIDCKLGGKRTRSLEFRVAKAGDESRSLAAGESNELGVLATAPGNMVDEIQKHCQVLSRRGGQERRGVVRQELVKERGNLKHALQPDQRVTSPISCRGTHPLHLGERRGPHKELQKLPLSIHPRQLIPTSLPTQRIDSHLLPFAWFLGCTGRLRRVVCYGQVPHPSQSLPTTHFSTAVMICRSSAVKFSSLKPLGGFFVCLFRFVPGYAAIFQQGCPRRALFRGSPCPPLILFVGGPEPCISVTSSLSSPRCC